MGYEIAWADEALRDLEALVAYIATNNPGRALQAGEDILGHTETLRAFPRIGPVYERAQDPRVRHVICDPYHIFYQVDDTPPVVHILHVWHSARQAPTL